jgi:hypothetical protein
VLYPTELRGHIVFQVVSTSPLLSQRANVSKMSLRPRVVFEYNSSGTMFLFHRSFSAIVGLLIGAISGMLALYFVMFVVGSDFGLDNVRPGALFGAVLGFFCGLRSQRRWSWRNFVG